METRDLSWPPPYTLKKHSKAKYVKLRTSLHKGLELIVPKRFNHREIPFILEKHKHWIEKQLQALAHQLQHLNTSQLPSDIALSAIGQIWKIQLIPTNQSLKILTRPNQEIVLMGKLDQKEKAKKLLMRWLRNQASIHLPHLLDDLCKKTGLSYRTVTLRNQKTRWGSCSKDKSINLNYKLILMPSHLAIHILIHELCHTVHLNHSPAFWELVARLDPHWQANRRELKKVKTLLPAWCF